MKTMGGKALRDNTGYHSDTGRPLLTNKQQHGYFIYHVYYVYDNVFLVILSLSLIWGIAARVAELEWRHNGCFG